VLQVIVDERRCQGAAGCVHYAPATFHLDDTFRAVAVSPVGDAEEAVLEAACSCPNGAIRVLRDGVELDF
jgi:ferredoxin